MIFVMEHDLYGSKAITILSDSDELETKRFEGLEKLFFCENTEEVQMVVAELMGDD